MITKSLLAEQVLRILSGGDISRDSSVTYQEVILAINQMRDKLVREDVWARRAAGDDDINGEYLSRYCVDVECDSKTGQYFSTLPVRPINLHRDKGVYKVSYVKDPSTAFVPSTATAAGLYKGLEAETMNGRKSYYLEADKIFYENVTGEDLLKQVLVVMVASSSEIGEDDEFPIPADKEADVIQYVVQLYSTQKQRPEDNINDNVDQ